jgi:hypothetical protein
MKCTVRLTIFFLILILSSEIFAQTFGIKAGLNMSTMSIVDNEVTVPYNTHNENFGLNPNLHLGVILELPLYYFQTGLILSSRGYKSSYTENFGETPLISTEKHNLIYLDIPLTTRIPFSLGGYNLYGLFGPYAGIGLFGNTKKVVTFNDLVEKEKEPILWGDNGATDDFRRLDYGLVFGAGIQLRSFQLTLSYNIGLENISPDRDMGSDLNNHVIGLSAGYLFAPNNKDVKKTPVPVEKKADKSKKNKKETEVQHKTDCEAERLRTEKIRMDSLATVKIEEERIRIEKSRSDSIEAVRRMADALEAEKLRLEKIRTDSIAEAAINSVIYRVQLISNTASKGNYQLTIDGKIYNTWEYFYSGAYRSTVGEFRIFKDALAFQKIVRQAGYPQAFVVAFRNNVRSTDPALFR